MAKHKRFSLVVAVLILTTALSIVWSNVLVSVASAETNYVNYVLEDSLSEYNAGNWTLYREKYLSDEAGVHYEDPVRFTGGINFTDDFTARGDAYEGAKVMSNVRFCKDPSRDETDVHTVFDVSFVVYQNNKENRAADVSFGLLFGMPAKESPISQGNYFEFTSFQTFLYRNGQRLEPEYLAKPDANGNYAFGGYFEYDFKLEARLVADSSGTLTVYYGFPDGKDIAEPYCRYTGLDVEGFLGFMGTSHVPEKTSFSVNFDGITLTGGTIADNNFTVLSAAADVSALATAVVSDQPIQLQSAVVTSPNLPQYHKAVFSIVSGDAEIRDGDLLYVHGSGEIVLRTSSFYDPNIYSDYSFSAVDLQISSIAFANSFDNITVNTQPFRLIANVQTNSYVLQHSDVVFEVIAGNAEIFSDRYLKINGAGMVILRATSAYLDDAFCTVAFEVTDPDAQFVPTEEAPSSCSGSASAASAAAVLPLSLFAAALLYKKRQG